MSDDYECGDYQSGEDRKVSRLVHHNAPADPGVVEDEAEGYVGQPEYAKGHTLGYNKGYRQAMYDLQDKLARAEAVIDAASDLHTHPALYSEAMLRSPSLKARWEAFSEALAKYRESSK